MQQRQNLVRIITEDPELLRFAKTHLPEHGGTRAEVFEKSLISQVLAHFADISGIVSLGISLYQIARPKRDQGKLRIGREKVRLQVRGKTFDFDDYSSTEDLGAALREHITQSSEHPPKP
jgi:hypothetical protein